MPIRPKKACPRCGRLYDVRCGCMPVIEYTESQKRYDKQRGTTAERGYGSKWQRLRLIKLRNDPLCERCLREGVDEIAKEVHHIKPISEGGAVLVRLDELESLCLRCHNKTKR